MTKNKNLHSLYNVLKHIVKGDSKVPFSIATTPKCAWEGATPFPGLLYFTLDTYLMMLSVKQGGQLIGLVGRVFTNGLRDRGSISDRVISKTLKMVLDTTLLNNQQYKVCIKNKVKQSRERSSALTYTSVS